MTQVRHSVNIGGMNAWINPFLILNGYFVFSSIQASSRFLSRLGAHLLSGLDSTCFRLPKERDCSSFFFCSCCYLFIYMLFIPLQPECHKSIHSLHIFSILLKCGNYQCAQWLGWTDYQSHPPLWVILQKCQESIRDLDIIQKVLQQRFAKVSLP